MSKNVSTKVIFTLFKILVFFTPLVFGTNTHESFEFPKMYFVYALGTTIIFIFSIKKVSLNEKVVWPNRLILLFLGGFLLSTALSTHLYTSIWGYYTRFNGGLASLLVFLGLHTVAINEFSLHQIKHLVKIAALSLIPIGLLALLQHYELVANIWGADSGERAFSTFGQPNWLAAYITMLIPVVLGFILGTFEKYESEAKNKFLWALVYFLAFITAWFAQSLSGLLGLIAGIAIFVRLNLDKLRINLDWFFLLMALSTGLALANPGIFKERLEDFYIDFKGLFYANAQTNITTTQNQYNLSDPGFIRRGLWKGTTEMVVSSPKATLIGTGPETFPYEFQRFRPVELNYSSEWNFVFNKPHNYYLELFANIGLIGLTLYLFIVVKSTTIKDTFFTPGLVALYVTNFFGWPTVATTLLFWLFLAGIEKGRQ